MVAQAGGRPGGRHHHRLGPQGRLLRRRRGGRGLPRRAQVPDHPPEGGVQLAGVVQHRRGRACPSRRRPASSSPSTTRWTPSSTGTSRRASSSRAARAPGINLSRIRSSQEGLKGGGTASGPVSFMRGADASAGTIKSRRQDPPGGQDGHPRRRPPRHRGLHLVQGHRGAQGPGAARRRLRHGPRRQGQPLDPVPERQQLGPGHRRVHAGGHRRRATGTCGPSPTGEVVQTVQGPRPVPPDRQGGVGVRRSRACSSTPRSTGGTPRQSPAGSTAATRARSTCTSTTRPATWPRSTC